MSFPNVPNVPGVPPLDRGINTFQQNISLQPDTSSTFGQPDAAVQWGIFKDGQPVVTAESVIRVEYRQDWDLLDYPLEKGAFESYNKVNSPFDARVRFASGESEQARQALLQSIETIAGTLELYDVITPEKIYQSTNVTHFDYSRTSDRGVCLLQVDVWVIEVRVVAVAKFSSVKSDAAADPVNDGTVQTDDATQQQIDKMYFDVRRQEPTNPQ